MKGRAVKWLGLGSALVLLLALNSGTRVMAQQYFGIIVGNVSDQSGAAVPDCTVTATNVNTGLTRTTKTDAAGGYRFESMVPGPYTVKAEKTGFQTSEVAQQELHVAASLTMDVVLQVGSVTQTVEVQAVAPLLNTTNATVGTTITNNNVLEMPLNGRAYTDLLELVPGSVNNGGGIYQATGSNYSVSGNRSEQNDYTLDGVSNNEEFFKAYGIQPAIDSIQEFQVRTNITSAEFGEAAGANVAVATKSGTNQLHGSAYEFVRNDKFDATEFFDDRAGISKTPLRRNQYGFTVGGPIYIPKVYNGHDKAFWFFNYEGVKVRQASTQLGTIPTTAQWGDFGSQPADLRDQPPIYDPTTGSQISCNGVMNEICPDRFDPFNIAYAKLWYPQTSLLAENAPGGYNSVVAQPYSVNQYQLNGRVDYKLKDSMQLFGRYTDQKQIAISPYALPNNYNTLDNHFQNGMVSLTWLASPTTVVDLKSAVNRTLIFTADNDRGWASFLADHPIDGTPIQNSRYPLFPEVYPGGWTSPSQTGNPFLSSIWQELASVSMIRGKHSMKAGFEFNYMQGWTDGLFTSQFNYSALQTSDPNPADTAATGSSLASFLLGVPSGGTRNVGITAAYMRDKTEALYFQDDIKVTRKLTVNAGLRWEYDKWPTEVHNHLSEFDFADNKFVWAGPNPLLGVGPNINDPSLMRPDYRDFAPRLGVAYGLTPKTTLRSGFGMFYGSNYYWEGQGARGTWPYAIGDTLEGLNAPGSAAIVYTEHMYPTYNSPVPGTPADAQHTMARDNRTPYSIQWNFGVQRELANNLMVEVEYVGDGGRHMPLFTNENDPAPGPGTVGQPGHFRPYQYADPVMGTYPSSTGFGADSEMDNVAVSAYNSLQVKIEKKFSNGLQFLASYAWGHYIDEGGSGFSQSSAPQIDNNFKADRGDGTFDYRHVFTGNWVYDLPAGQGRRFLNHANPIVTAVLGGWEFTGITHFNTGGPLGFGVNKDIANTGQRSLTERPDLISGQPQRTTPSSGMDQTTGYANKAAFVEPALYTYGNLGRNTARQLGFENFDLGLYKNFPIHENKQSIQFRAEFFNAFNHVNLGGIDGTIEDTSFGSIGGTQNNSREIQFALKLYF